MEPVNDLERLGSLAAEHQDRRLDELVDLGAARRRFLSASARRTVGTRTKILVAAAIGIAACLALFMFAGREPAPLTFRVGDKGRLGEVDAWLEASAGKAMPLRFSDGTKVRLEPNARARVTHVDPAGATVRLESGRANVSVVKRKGAAWRVSLGPFRVEVTGTRFDINWDPGNDRLLLQMHEGSVVVSGCVFGPGRSVVAGETALASCRDPLLEISSGATARSRETAEGASGSVTQSNRIAKQNGSPAEEPANIDDAPIPSGAGIRDEHRRASTGPSTAAPDWRELVRNGRHGEALDAAEAAGFSSECRTSSAADLVALGDAARYTGRLERAVEAYHAVRKRFPGHERSAVAAFALGRIAFDHRGDFAEAARWFRTYLGERPGGRLDRDALGRLMESLSRLGDTAGARTEAKRYLERHPKGPHAEMARRLTGE
jgi:TolA-binding protein